MDDNKNRKSNEALPDETQTGKVLPDEAQTGEALPDDALENVAGGGSGGLVQGAVREGINPADGDESTEELSDDALENVAGGALRTGSRTYLNKTPEELPDDALENVAGGGFKDWVLGLFDKPDDQGSGQ